MAVLLIFDGESGSGGAGLAASCTGAEITVRTKTKMFDSTTGKFQSLLVGANQQRSHVSKTIASLGPNMGWEVGIANDVDAGTFNSGQTTYILKIGRGSSFISEFASGYTDANGINVRAVKFQKIVDCITEMNRLGLSVNPFILFSMGINDQVIATPAATWETDTGNYMTALKNQVNSQVLSITGQTVNVPALYSKLTPTFNAYDANIQTLAGAGLYFETSDLTFRDTAHLDYAGLKVLATRFLTKVQTYL